MSSRPEKIAKCDWYTSREMNWLGGWGVKSTYQYNNVYMRLTINKKWWSATLSPYMDAAKCREFTSIILEWFSFSLFWQPVVSVIFNFHWFISFQLIYFFSEDQRWNMSIVDFYRSKIFFFAYWIHTFFIVTFFIDWFKNGIWTKCCVFYNRFNRVNCNFVN